MPVPDVWQHRFEELHRERLHLLRPVAVRLHEGHEHLDSDDREQLAQPLDHIWVLVAAAAQCDRAALAQVWAQQRAALEQHVAHERHERRAHLLRRLGTRVRAEAFNHDRHEEGKRASHLGRVHGPLPTAEERNSQVAALFRLVGEAQQQRPEQRLELVRVQLSLGERRERPLTHVRLARRDLVSRAAEVERSLSGAVSGAARVLITVDFFVVVAIVVISVAWQADEVLCPGLRDLRLAGREDAVQRANGGG